MLTEYELLVAKIYNEGIEVYEMPLESNSKGLCDGNAIALNTNMLDTSVQKRYILSEEVWHSKTTVGDITDTTSMSNLKQEHLARKYSLNDLVPLDKVVEALLNYCINLQDMCEYLNIPEECFFEAMTYYKKRYGISYRCKDYTLYFEPLYVLGSSIQGDDAL